MTRTAVFLQSVSDVTLPVTSVACLHVRFHVHPESAFYLWTSKGERDLDPVDSHNDGVFRKSVLALPSALIEIMT